MAMYENFAYIYDRMMEDVNYSEWADYIQELFSHYQINPRNIADLACGTGNITTIMAQRGYNMIGIDSSKDMLMIAQEKSRKKGLKIPFICQDIRDIALHKSVDAVLIICDGINYIIDDRDLYRVFFGINSILSPGGILLFDISSHYKLSSILGNNTIIDDDGDITLIWENSFDGKEDICRMELTFFVKENSYYKRFDEFHVQRAHHIQDIFNSLEQSKFENINCYKHLTLEEPSEKDQRYLFAAQKF